MVYGSKNTYLSCPWVYVLCSLRGFGQSDKSTVYRLTKPLLQTKLIIIHIICVDPHVSHIRQMNCASFGRSALAAVPKRN